MRRVRGLLVGMALVGGVGGAMAIDTEPAVAQASQSMAYIQIEAKNSRPRIDERTQYWAQNLPDVTAFAMASGWYAVALGPYPREEAEAKLRELRLLRAIPSDSFIADARIYRGQLDSPTGVAPAPLAPISGAEGAPTTSVEVAPIAPPAVSAPAMPSEETLAQAKQAELALSREGRMDIQRALIWAGALASGVDGAFGPGTRGAISAWQTQKGYEATGVLSTLQREALVGGWQAEVAALGLETVRDEEAGIEVDLPLGLVTFKDYAPPFAKFEAKGDSGMQIWLISQPGDLQALNDLYAHLQTLPFMPAEGPRTLRARGFDIRGADGQVETQAWAELSQGAIKGYILTGPSSENERSARVLKALESSFKGLNGQILDPGLVPLDEAAKAGMMTGVEKRLPRKAGTGFFATSQGHVMTAASVVEACGRITLDGGVEAQRMLSDAATGTAILRPMAPLAPHGVAQFSTALPHSGSEIAVAGYSFGADLSLPSVTFGRFEAPTALDGSPNRARLSLPALSGDIGGAVLGGDGRVVGVLQDVPSHPSRELPDTVSYLASAPNILAAIGAELPGLQSMDPVVGVMADEDISQIGTSMAVQVLCWD